MNDDTTTEFQYTGVSTNWAGFEFAHASRQYIVGKPIPSNEDNPILNYTMLWEVQDKATGNTWNGRVCDE